MSNPTCAMCPVAFNGINGRYCYRLHSYVEYAKVPPCNNKQNS